MLDNSTTISLSQMRENLKNFEEEKWHQLWIEKALPLLQRD